jgi:hypothetical protein
MYQIFMPQYFMDLAALAQLAARAFHNPEVADSIPPTGGSNIFVQILSFF